MTVQKPRALHLTLITIFALVAAASSGIGAATAAVSPWVPGQKAKARLLAGTPPSGSGPIAFVEIALEPGWKTYWRTPGDAGGLPPTFDWSKSTNLAQAKVAFPAPQRFTDKSGNTIGYTDGVLLPVFLTPKDPSLPISLVAGIHYGICKDICIPVEAELTLEIPAKTADALPFVAQQALAQLPKAQDALEAGDPVVVRAEAVTTGAAPKITVEARFPGGSTGADAFLEAPNGLYLPLPERVGEIDSEGRVVFEALLGADVDLAALKGKPVTVTLVSETGASFATFVAE